MVGSTNACNNDCVIIAIINGKFSSTSGSWTSYYPYPDGWTDIDKIALLPLEVYNTGTSGWRVGEGSDSATKYRFFVEKSANGIRAYCTSSTYLGKDFRIGLIYSI